MLSKWLREAQLLCALLVLVGCTGGTGSSKADKDQNKVDQEIFADPSTGGPDSKQATQPAP